MSDGAGMLLLDTNVWLDFFMRNRPGNESAERLIRFARENGWQLLYPVGVLKDVFYLASSGLKRDIRSSGREVGDAELYAASQFAWSCVDSMRELAHAVGADESDAWMAAKYRTLNADLEDNFVLVAAMRLKTACLITSDLQLIRKAPVAAMTPSDWLLANG